MANIKEHFTLIKKFVPNLKVLGIPYNPGEANAVSMLDSAKVVAEKWVLKL